MRNIHDTLFGKALSILLCWSVLLMSLPLYAANTVNPEAGSELRLSNYSPQPLQTVATNFEYDGNNNIVARIDGNGNRTEYEYDKINRLKSIDYPGGDGPEVHFTYDGNGNLTSMTDWTGTTRYTYDDLDRITAVDYPDGNVIMYGYDLVGNIAWVACGTRSEEDTACGYSLFKEIGLCAYHLVYYEYDPDNRISSATDGLIDETTSYTYDEAGNLTQCDFPNGCYTIYGYDVDGHLVEAENRNASNELIAKYEYTLNSIGNRIKVVETTTSDTKATTYTYDVLDRLDTVSYPDGRTVDYDYDSFGNRTKMKEFRGNTMTVTEYFYDSDSRLLYTKVNGIEDEQFSYDAIGNLIRRTGPDDNKQTIYTYDHENRLVGYNDGTNDVTYVYDGMGYRVAKTVNGKRIGFLNDINRRYVEAIAELDASGEPTHMRIWGNDLVSVRGHYIGTLHYYLHDSPAGNVSRVLNPDGQTVNSYEYDAFGTPINETESIDNNYQFHGEVQEEETGLLFLRARYYDPSTGRFLTRDPVLGNLTHPQSLSPYTFSKNSPVTYRDPSGCEAIAISLSVVVGIIIVIAMIEFATRPARETILQARNWQWPRNIPGANEIFWQFEQSPYSMLGNSPRFYRRDRPPKGWFKLFVAALAGSVAFREMYQNKLLRWAVEALLRDALDFGDKVPTSSIDIDDDSQRGTGSPPGGGGGMGGGGSDGGDGLGGGGIVSQSRPGGVDLNQTAEVMMDISDIKGVTYDSKTGQLIIYGEHDVSLPTMNLDDLSVAARAVERGLTPVVSIEDPCLPCEDNGCNDSWCYTVRYGPAYKDEQTGEVTVYDVASGTHFGWVMFEADRTVKILGLGKDNITCAPVSSGVPGFKTMVERWSENAPSEGSSARFWFQPRDITLVPSPDGKSMVFDEVSMELLTESTYLSDGEFFDDPEMEAFVKHFNNHFDEFAEEFPIFKELNQLAKIYAIVRWMKENEVVTDLSFLTQHEPAFVETPLITPRTEVRTEDGLMWQRVIGGVTYEREPIYGAPEEGPESAVLAARPSENPLSWTIDIDGIANNAIAISLEEKPMDGSFAWSDTDLVAKVNGAVPLALTRHYDSFNIEQGPFGWGWSAMPYQLQYKGAESGFYFETSEQEGYDRISFIDRNTQSVFDYEPGSFYDKQADPYQIAREFDSQDDILVYYHELKKLPGILFSDGPDRFMMRMANGALLNFDAEGKLVDIKDRNGNKIVYGYDQSSKLVSISQPSSGRTISLSYDSNGRIISAMGPGGKTMNYTYDAAGNLVQVAQYIPEAQASVNRTAITLMEVYQGTSESESTEYRYDDQHCLIEVIDSDGQTLFTLKYDVYGRIVSQTGPAATTEFTAEYSLADGKTQTIGPEDFFQLREYDENYDLIRWTDARGNATNFAYNSNQNLTSIVDAEGYTTKFYYRQEGYPVAVTWPNGNSDFVDLNAFGYPIEFLQIPPNTDFEDNFDEEHLLADEWQVNYINKVQYEWDDVGNLKKIIDAQLNEYGFEYDSRGNLDRFVDARGFGTSYTYDGFSRLTKVSNEMGHAVSFDYDERDNLTVVTTEAGNVELTYDAQDRLHSIIYGDNDARQSYVYGYNANNQLQTVTSPDGTVTSYVYDESGNLTQIIHDEVMRFEYEYDDLNRIIQIRYSGTVSSELN